MRERPLPEVERGRVKVGYYASTPEFGCNGAFKVRHGGVEFVIIASTGLGWEHVSVSLDRRCPTWDEMCWVKGLFWGPDECVIQYHPPASAYVNNHPYCLHLWRPIGQTIPMPPQCMI